MKKCKALQHDINIYERAADGSPEKTYKFLYDAARNHINRKRLERNRERIAKQTAGLPTAPAPKRVPKGFCVAFVRNGSCNKGESCKYKPEIPQQRGRSNTPNINGGRGRSPGGRAHSGSQPRKQECKFFKVGKCDRGDKCRFVHKSQPSVPAPSGAESGGSSRGRKDKKQRKKKKDRTKSKSSSRSSRSSRSSKSSKGSKGSKGSGKGKKTSLPAAVCLLGAMLAGSASSAEGFAFREDMLGPADHCTPLAYPALSAVRFNDVPEYLSVPVNQTSEVLSPVTDKAREYQKHYPVDYRAKPCTQSLRESQAAAKMLRASILQLEAGVRTKCKYECETEFGCMHCIPGNMTVSCPARCRRDNFTPTIEWIGDTGSAQDLISEHDLEGHPSRTSENPINIMTANGPSSADQQIKVNVPSLGIEADPYVLPSTPSVLSIGYRCMEQGFDFIWKACCRPYFRDKKGKQDLPRR